MGWHSQGALASPPAPPHPSRDPVLGLLLKWTALPLQASVGSKLRIAARADAATDERVWALWISMAQIWTSGTARARSRSASIGTCSSPTIAPRQSWRQYSAETTSGEREATVTDILPNDEISLLRSLEKKSRTITGNFTHKRYDRLETKGYIKRSSQPPSMQDILYEITDAGKAALRAVGGASE